MKNARTVAAIDVLFLASFRDQVLKNRFKPVTCVEYIVQLLAPGSFHKHPEVMLFTSSTDH